MNKRVLAFVSIGTALWLSSCSGARVLESRKLASESRPDLLTQIQERYRIPPKSERVLSDEKLKISKPSLTDDHRTVVPLVQTSQTPSKVEIALTCVSQKYVCLERELAPMSGYAGVSNLGSSGAMQFSLNCTEWGYKEVRHKRPIVIYFDESSKPKGDAQNVYVLSCDDSEGGAQVSLRPEYSSEVEFCSRYANKVTTDIQKRFLLKDKTVFAVFNDQKESCSTNH